MAQNANLARKYRDGQDCSFYRAERLQEQKLERELISDMQPSLRSGAFRVYLQPKVQLTAARSAARRRSSAGTIQQGDAVARGVHTGL